MKRVKNREESDGEKTGVVHKTLLVQSSLNLPREIIKELNVIDIQPEIQLALLLSAKIFQLGCLQEKMKLFSLFRRKLEIKSYAGCDGTS